MLNVCCLKINTLVWSDKNCLMKRKSLSIIILAILECQKKRGQKEQGCDHSPALSNLNRVFSFEPLNTLRQALRGWNTSPEEGTELGKVWSTILMRSVQPGEKEVQERAQHTLQLPDRRFQPGFSLFSQVTSDRRRRNGTWQCFTF